MLNVSNEKYSTLSGVSSIESRKEVILLITAGRVQESLDLISSLYPTLIEDNPLLYAKLLCLQFVEIYRSVCVNSEDVNMDGTRYYDII